MEKKAQDNWFLGLILAEYARQLDEGIAAAYAGLAEHKETATPIRVWLPFPVGPLIQNRSPTESDPAHQWEWESAQPRIPALRELEEVMRRFRGFVDAVQGGDDGG